MRSSAALFVGLLVVVSVAAGVGAGQPREATAQPSSASSGSPTVLADAPTASGPPTAVDASANAINASTNATVRDATSIHVGIEESGNAKWNVTAKFVLENDNETDAFRQLARDYESGNAEGGFTRETFDRFLEHAASDTERSMALRDVSRTGDVRENGTVGTLSLAFTWTNFTQVQGNRVVLGDVFWLESGTWLPSLTDDQSLTIEGPTNYYIASANVPHNSTRIEFEGPRAFESGDFAVTYAPKTTETTTEEPTTSTTTESFPDISGTSGLLVVLVVFGIGFGAYAVSQRREPDPEVTESNDSDGEQAVASAETVADEEAPTDEGESEDDADGPPTELLSDEERVLRLLRERDGRMKQADIVTETNWSNAKVSQLLSKMNENGDVNKLRIGRENLITLPDEDVTDFD